MFGQKRINALWQVLTAKVRCVALIGDDNKLHCLMGFLHSLDGFVRQEIAASALDQHHRDFA